MSAAPLWNSANHLLLLPTLIFSFSTSLPHLQEPRCSFLVAVKQCFECRKPQVSCLIEPLVTPEVPMTDIAASV